MNSWPYLSDIWYGKCATFHYVPTPLSTRLVISLHILHPAARRIESAHLLLCLRTYLPSWPKGVKFLKQETQLSQRDCATRYVIKFVLHSTSDSLRVIKVPNSKSDLQGRSRALAMVSFDRPHTISY